MAAGAEKDPSDGAAHDNELLMVCTQCGAEHWWPLAEDVAESGRCSTCGTPPVVVLADRA